ncbi:MAG: DUF4962 domain-containing protein [Acidobacteria bacterium]|nr:DUF4962 domain-containing protein [Acidobacteriota bacterium]MBI3278264.1 DUF4962 domain-containing protein [Acidobacteriota bacterium]
MRRGLCLLFAVAGATVFAQVDRDPKPDEWGYRPADGATVPVNPPSLTWVLDPQAAGYKVQWADNAGFVSATTAGSLRWTAYTHHRPLKPGTYWWRYCLVSKNGEESGWSRPRKFVVPRDAVEFPQPSMEELRQRIPKSHPRLFVRRDQLESLRGWARGGGQAAYRKLIDTADALLGKAPTPEPKVRANSKDPNTNRFWWPNRVQTIKALEEAEVLAFAWLLTGDRKYGDTARRFTLELAAWDPDGPTNFKINCEAAKPMLHRLARAYDWAYDRFSDEERERIRGVLLRRALDAWESGEVRQGAGHLNQPYNSHGNRTWHKLAENAVATFGETAESEKFLDYAVTKFFAAYPAWSDDDGGWHEGVSYYAGYLTKMPWWMQVAKTALGIDGFKKPFFRNFAEYPMYSAPPGSPDMGFGDLSFRPPSPQWSFMHFFVRESRNPYWAWWARETGIQPEPGEPVMAFLWGATANVPVKPPTDIPTSKVFRGTGVAVLNSTLLASADNVQVRFKSSPMGRWSHGHDPHNSFTLNAYGTALLVNNVYRDLHGSRFHTGWCWSTRAQNALLVNGEGQKTHSADLGGRIVSWDFQDGVHHVAGDAAASYEGKLKRFVRHVLLIKPDIVVLADDVEAAQPSTFQWMLHGLKEFSIDGQRLRIDREQAGAVVDYIAERPLEFKQWTGYSPEPDHRYLASVGNPGFPPQWHLEAASVSPAASAFTVAVVRPYRKGQTPAGDIRVERTSGALTLRIPGQNEVTVVLRKPGGTAPEFATVRRNGREWRIKAEEKR